LRNWANANLVSRGAGLAIPGGVRLRSDQRDENMMAAGAGNEQARSERDLSNTATPQATALEIGQQAVNAIGRGRDTVESTGEIARDAYNRIRYGQPPASVTIDGQAIGRDAILAMSPDERKALADAWLAQSQLGDERQAYFDRRDEVIAGMP